RGEDGLDPGLHVLDEFAGGIGRWRQAGTLPRFEQIGERRVHSDDLAATLVGLFGERAESRDGGAAVGDIGVAERHARIVLHGDSGGFGFARRSKGHGVLAAIDDGAAGGAEASPATAASAATTSRGSGFGIGAG